MTASIKPRMRITLDLYLSHSLDWPVACMAPKECAGAACIAAASYGWPRSYGRVTDKEEEEGREGGRGGGGEGGRGERGKWVQQRGIARPAAGPGLRQVGPWAWGGCAGVFLAAAARYFQQHECSLVLPGLAL